MQERQSRIERGSFIEWSTPQHYQGEAIEMSNISVKLLVACSHTHAHMCTRSLFSLLRERKGVIAFDLREVIQIVLYAARPNVLVEKRKISNPFCVRGCDAPWREVVGVHTPCVCKCVCVRERGRVWFSCVCMFVEVCARPPRW